MVIYTVSFIAHAWQVFDIFNIFWFDIYAQNLFLILQPDNKRGVNVVPKVTLSYKCYLL